MQKGTHFRVPKFAAVTLVDLEGIEPSSKQFNLSVFYMLISFVNFGNNQPNEQ